MMFYELIWMQMYVKLTKLLEHFTKLTHVGIGADIEQDQGTLVVTMSPTSHSIVDMIIKV